MKSEMLALAARVEAATGPDRELDSAIAAACRAGLPSGCEWAFKFPRWEEDASGQVRIIGNVNGNGDYISGRFTSPLFTASLDAAMTLVPEDRRLHSLGETASMIGGPWLALLTARSEYHENGIAGKGQTAPLALTAAALRARATEESPHV